MPQHQTLQFAVLGQQSNADFDGVAGRPDVENLAIQSDLAGVSGIGPEQQPDRLGAAGPNQSSQRQNLTLVHLKGNALDRFSPAQAQRLEPRTAPFHTAGGELLIQRSSHHAFDHLIAGDGMDGAVGDIAPVAQNSHPIGDGEHLFQPVADVEDPHSLTPQFPHEDEELLNLVGGQRGRGFVHDEDPSLVD